VILPNITEIAKLQKAVKELIDDEIEERLKKGQKMLEAIDAEVTESTTVMG